MAEIANLLATPSEWFYPANPEAPHRECFKVVRVDFEIEGLFERWCEQQARLAIARHKADMDPGEYQNQMDGWRRDCAAHLYAWQGPMWFQSMTSEQGAQYLAYLRLQKGNPRQPAAKLMEIIRKAWRDENEYAHLQAAMEAADPPVSAPTPTPDQAESPGQ